MGHVLEMNVANKVEAVVFQDNVNVLEAKEKEEVSEAEGLESASFSLASPQCAPLQWLQRLAVNKRKFLEQCAVDMGSNVSILDVEWVDGTDSSLRRFALSRSRDPLRTRVTVQCLTETEQEPVVLELQIGGLRWVDSESSCLCGSLWNMGASRDPYHVGKVVDEKVHNIHFGCALISLANDLELYRLEYDQKTGSWRVLSRWSARLRDSTACDIETDSQVSNTALEANWNERRSTRSRLTKDPKNGDHLGEQGKENLAATSDTDIPHIIIVGCRQTPYCIVLNQPFGASKRVAMESPKRGRRICHQERRDRPTPESDCVSPDTTIAAWDVCFGRPHWLGRISVREAIGTSMARTSPVPLASALGIVCSYDSRSSSLHVLWFEARQNNDGVSGARMVEIQHRVPLAMSVTMRDALRNRSLYDMLTVPAAPAGDEEQSGMSYAVRSSPRKKASNAAKPLRTLALEENQTGEIIGVNLNDKLGAALSVMIENGSTETWLQTVEACRQLQRLSGCMSVLSRDTHLGDNRRGHEPLSVATHLENILNTADERSAALLRQGARHPNDVNASQDALPRELIRYEELMMSFPQHKSLIEIAGKYPHLALGEWIIGAPAGDMIQLLVHRLRRNEKSAPISNQANQRDSDWAFLNAIYAYPFVSNAELHKALSALSLRDTCRILRDVEEHVERAKHLAEGTDALTGALMMASLLLDAHFTSLALSERPLLERLLTVVHAEHAHLEHEERLRGMIEQFLCTNA